MQPCAGARLTCRPSLAPRVAGYLPLVWAGTLAYYLDNAFEEAGLILPVAAATFGLDAPWLPTFVVDPVSGAQLIALQKAMHAWLLLAPALARHARTHPHTHCAPASPSPQLHTLGLPNRHPPPPQVVTEFLQGSTLLFGAAASAVLTRKLAARHWPQLWPQVALIAAFTAELWSLILPN